LCDTFEGFPEEKLGIDKLWNNTHSVDFEMVKKQFTGYKNVQLVKGDFKDTINTLPDKEYSLVHVDCDSYRATKFVAEKMYPKLSKGGVMMFEDYGHPFCLSARIAVDQYFSKQKNFFAFFSGFSGLYIVVKS